MSIFQESGKATPTKHTTPKKVIYDEPDDVVPAEYDFSTQETIDIPTVEGIDENCKEQLHKIADKLLSDSYNAELTSIRTTEAHRHNIEGDENKAITDSDDLDPSNQVLEEATGVLEDQSTALVDVDCGDKNMLFLVADQLLHTSNNQSTTDEQTTAASEDTQDGCDDCESAAPVRVRGKVIKSNNSRVIKILPTPTTTRKKHKMTKRWRNFNWDVEHTRTYTTTEEYSSLLLKKHQDKTTTTASTTTVTPSTEPYSETPDIQELLPPESNSLSEDNVVNLEEIGNPVFPPFPQCGDLDNSVDPVTLISPETETQGFLSVSETEIEAPNPLYEKKIPEEFRELLPAPRDVDMNQITDNIDFTLDDSNDIETTTTFVQIPSLFKDIGEFNKSKLYSRAEDLLTATMECLPPVTLLAEREETEENLETDTDFEGLPSIVHDIGEFNKSKLQFEAEMLLTTTTETTTATLSFTLLPVEFEQNEEFTELPPMVHDIGEFNKSKLLNAADNLLTTKSDLDLTLESTTQFVKIFEETVSEEYTELPTIVHDIGEINKTKLHQEAERLLTTSKSDDSLTIVDCTERVIEDYVSSEDEFSIPSMVQDIGEFNKSKIFNEAENLLTTTAKEVTLEEICYTEANYDYMSDDNTPSPLLPVIIPTEPGLDLISTESDTEKPIPTISEIKNTVSKTSRESLMTEHTEEESGELAFTKSSELLSLSNTYHNEENIQETSQLPNSQMASTLGAEVLVNNPFPERTQATLCVGCDNKTQEYGEIINKKYTTEIATEFENNTDTSATINKEHIFAYMEYIKGTQTGVYGPEDGKRTSGKVEEEQSKATTIREHAEDTQVNNKISQSENGSNNKLETDTERLSTKQTESEEKGTITREPDYPSEEEEDSVLIKSEGKIQNVTRLNEIPPGYTQLTNLTDRLDKPTTATGQEHILRTNKGSFGTDWAEITNQELTTRPKNISEEEDTRGNETDEVSRRIQLESQLSSTTQTAEENNGNEGEIKNTSRKGHTRIITEENTEMTTGNEGGTGSEFISGTEASQIKEMATQSEENTNQNINTVRSKPTAAKQITTKLEESDMGVGTSQAAQSILVTETQSRSSESETEQTSERNHSVTIENEGVETEKMATEMGKQIKQKTDNEYLDVSTTSQKGKTNQQMEIFELKSEEKQFQQASNRTNEEGETIESILMEFTIRISTEEPSSSGTPPSAGNISYKNRFPTVGEEEQTSNNGEETEYTHKISTVKQKAEVTEIDQGYTSESEFPEKNGKPTNEPEEDNELLTNPTDYFSREDLVYKNKYGHFQNELTQPKAEDKKLSTRVTQSFNTKFSLTTNFEGVETSSEFIEENQVDTATGSFSKNISLNMLEATEEISDSDMLAFTKAGTYCELCPDQDNTETASENEISRNESTSTTESNDILKATAAVTDNGVFIFSQATTICKSCSTIHKESTKLKQRHTTSKVTTPHSYEDEYSESDLTFTTERTKEQITGITEEDTENHEAGSSEAEKMEFEKEKPTTQRTEEQITGVVKDGIEEHKAGSSGAIETGTRNTEITGEYPTQAIDEEMEKTRVEKLTTEKTKYQMTDIIEEEIREHKIRSTEATENKPGKKKTTSKRTEEYMTDITEQTMGEHEAKTRKMKTTTESTEEQMSGATEEGLIEQKVGTGEAEMSTTEKTGSVKPTKTKTGKTRITTERAEEAMTNITDEEMEHEVSSGEATNIENGEKKSTTERTEEYMTDITEQEIKDYKTGLVKSTTTKSGKTKTFSEAKEDTTNITQEEIIEVKVGPSESTKPDIENIKPTTESTEERMTDMVEEETDEHKTGSVEPSITKTGKTKAVTESTEEETTNATGKETVKHKTIPGEAKNIEAEEEKSTTEETNEHVTDTGEGEIDEHKIVSSEPTKTGKTKIVTESAEEATTNNSEEQIEEVKIEPTEATTKNGNKRPTTKKTKEHMTNIAEEEIEQYKTGSSEPTESTSGKTETVTETAEEEMADISGKEIEEDTVGTSEVTRKTRKKKQTTERTDEHITNTVEEEIETYETGSVVPTQTRNGKTKTVTKTSEEMTDISGKEIVDEVEVSTRKSRKKKPSTERPEEHISNIVEGEIETYETGLVESTETKNGRTKTVTETAEEKRTDISGKEIVEDKVGTGEVTTRKTRRKKPTTERTEELLTNIVGEASETDKTGSVESTETSHAKTKTVTETAEEEMTDISGKEVEEDKVGTSEVPTRKTGKKRSTTERTEEQITNIVEEEIENDKTLSVESTETTNGKTKTVTETYEGEMTDISGKEIVEDKIDTSEVSTRKSRKKKPTTERTEEYVTNIVEEEIETYKTGSVESTETKNGKTKTVTETAEEETTDISGKDIVEDEVGTGEVTTRKTRRKKPTTERTEEHITNIVEEETGSMESTETRNGKIKPVTETAEEEMTEISGKEVEEDKVGTSKLSTRKTGKKKPTTERTEEHITNIGEEEIETYKTGSMESTETRNGKTKPITETAKEEMTDISGKKVEEGKVGTSAVSTRKTRKKKPTTEGTEEHITNIVEEEIETYQTGSVEPTETRNGKTKTVTETAEEEMTDTSGKAIVEDKVGTSEVSTRKSRKKKPTTQRTEELIKNIVEEEIETYETGSTQTRNGKTKTVTETSEEEMTDISGNKIVEDKVGTSEISTRKSRKKKPTSEGTEEYITNIVEEEIETYKTGSVESTETRKGKTKAVTETAEEEVTVIPRKEILEDKIGTSEVEVSTRKTGKKKPTTERTEEHRTDIGKGEETNIEGDEETCDESTGRTEETITDVVEEENEEYNFGSDEPIESKNGKTKTATVKTEENVTNITEEETVGDEVGSNEKTTRETGKKKGTTVKTEEDTIEQQVDKYKIKTGRIKPTTEKAKEKISGITEEETVENKVASSETNKSTTEGTEDTATHAIEEEINEHQVGASKITIIQSGKETSTTEITEEGMTNSNEDKIEGHKNKSTKIQTVKAKATTERNKEEITNVTEKEILEQKVGLSKTTTRESENEPTTEGTEYHVTNITEETNVQHKVSSNEPTELETRTSEITEEYTTYTIGQKMQQNKSKTRKMKPSTQRPEKEMTSGTEETTAEDKAGISEAEKSTTVGTEKNTTHIEEEIEEHEISSIESTKTKTGKTKAVTESAEEEITEITEEETGGDKVEASEAAAITTKIVNKEPTTGRTEEQMTGIVEEEINRSKTSSVETTETRSGKTKTVTETAEEETTNISGNKTVEDKVGTSESSTRKTRKKKPTTERTEEHMTDIGEGEETKTGSDEETCEESTERTEERMTDIVEEDIDEYNLGSDEPTQKKTGKTKAVSQSAEGEVTNIPEGKTGPTEATPKTKGRKQTTEKAKEGTTDIAEEEIVEPTETSTGKTKAGTGVSEEGVTNITEFESVEDKVGPSKATTAEPTKTKTGETKAVTESVEGELIDITEEETRGDKVKQSETTTKIGQKKPTTQATEEHITNNVEEEIETYRTGSMEPTGTRNGKTKTVTETTEEETTGIYGKEIEEEKVGTSEVSTKKTRKPKLTTESTEEHTDIGKGEETKTESNEETCDESTEKTEDRITDIVEEDIEEYNLGSDEPTETKTGKTKAVSESTEEEMTNGTEGETSPTKATTITGGKEQTTKKAKAVMTDIVEVEPTETSTGNTKAGTERAKEGTTNITEEEIVEKEVGPSEATIAKSEKLKTTTERTEENVTVIGKEEIQNHQKSSVQPPKTPTGETQSTAKRAEEEITNVSKGETEHKVGPGGATKTEIGEKNSTTESGEEYVTGTITEVTVEHNEELTMGHKVSSRQAVEIETRSTEITIEDMIHTVKDKKIGSTDAIGIETENKTSDTEKTEEHVTDISEHVKSTNESKEEYLTDRTEKEIEEYKIASTNTRTKEATQTTGRPERGTTDIAEEVIVKQTVGSNAKNRTGTTMYGEISAKSEVGTNSKTATIETTDLTSKKPFFENLRDKIENEITVLEKKMGLITTPLHKFDTELGSHQTRKVTSIKVTTEHNSGDLQDRIQNGITVLEKKLGLIPSTPLHRSISTQSSQRAKTGSIQQEPTEVIVKTELKAKTKKAELEYTEGENAQETMSAQTKYQPEKNHVSEKSESFESKTKNVTAENPQNSGKEDMQNATSASKFSADEEEEHVSTVDSEEEKNSGAEFENTPQKKTVPETSSQMESSKSVKELKKESVTTEEGAVTDKQEKLTQTSHIHISTEQMQKGTILFEEEINKETNSYSSGRKYLQTTEQRGGQGITEFAEGNEKRTLRSEEDHLQETGKEYQRSTELEEDIEHEIITTGRDEEQSIVELEKTENSSEHVQHEVTTELLKAGDEVPDAEVFIFPHSVTVCEFCSIQTKEGTQNVSADSDEETEERASSEVERGGGGSHEITTELHEETEIETVIEGNEAPTHNEDEPEEGTESQTSTEERTVTREFEYSEHSDFEKYTHAKATHQDAVTDEQEQVATNTKFNSKNKNADLAEKTELRIPTEKEGTESLAETETQETEEESIRNKSTERGENAEQHTRKPHPTEEQIRGEASEIKIETTHAIVTEKLVDHKHTPQKEQHQLAEETEEQTTTEMTKEHITYITAETEVEENMESQIPTGSSERSRTQTGATDQQEYTETRIRKETESVKKHTTAKRGVSQSTINDDIKGFTTETGEEDDRTKETVSEFTIKDMVIFEKPQETTSTSDQSTRVDTEALSERGSLHPDNVSAVNADSLDNDFFTTTVVMRQSKVTSAEISESEQLDFSKKTTYCESCENSSYDEEETPMSTTKHRLSHRTKSTTERRPLRNMTLHSSKAHMPSAETTPVYLHSTHETEEDVESRTQTDSLYEDIAATTFTEDSAVTVTSTFGGKKSMHSHKRSSKYPKDHIGIGMEEFALNTLTEKENHTATVPHASRGTETASPLERSSEYPEEHPEIGIEEFALQTLTEKENFTVSVTQTFEGMKTNPSIGTSSKYHKEHLEYTKSLVFIINNSGRKIEKVNETLLEILLNKTISDVDLEYIDINKISADNKRSDKLHAHNTVSSESSHNTVSSESSHILDSFSSGEANQTCSKSDFEFNRPCVCDVDDYLKHLKKRIPAKSKFDVKEFECRKFFNLQDGLVITNKSVPVQRKKRSLLYLSNVNKTSNVMETDIDNLLEDDYELIETDISLYGLPGSAMKIPCHNKADFILENKGATFSWAFQKDDTIDATESIPGTEEVAMTVKNLNIKNAGNYTCTRTNEDGKKEEFVHELEIITFPIYKISMSIFYAVNDGCSLNNGDVLYTYLPNLIGSLLCGKSGKMCTVNVQRPRCLTKDDDSFFNVSVTAKMNTITEVFPHLNQSMCDVNCKLKVYVNLVGLVNKNAEIVQSVPVFSSLEPHLNFLTNDSYVEKLTTDSPTIIASCLGGFGIEKEKQRICVLCPKHTHSPDDEAYCKMCPSGQYQPSPGSTSCIPCLSPVDDSMCLRMLYSDTKLFKTYIGVGFGLFLLIVIIILFWRSGSMSSSFSYSRVSTTNFDGSPKHRTARKRDADIERAVREPLLKQDQFESNEKTPPKVPPPDF